jgi:hypothetical protein
MQILVVFGSRSVFSFRVVQQCLIEAIKYFSLNKKDLKIISGGSIGVDKSVERFAKEQKIPFEEFPAQWNTYGKSAGFRRNEFMANIADFACAIWDGKSNGTKHMIDTCSRLGIRTKTFVITKNFV